MGILDKILKKKPEEDYNEPPARREGLPSELEEFRLESPRVEEKPSPFEEKSFIPRDISEKTSSMSAPKNNIDKIDLILSKLETIDTRLKLIEEKLK